MFRHDQFAHVDKILCQFSSAYFHEIGYLEETLMFLKNTTLSLVVSFNEITMVA